MFQDIVQKGPGFSKQGKRKWMEDLAYQGPLQTRFVN